MFIVIGDKPADTEVLNELPTASGTICDDALQQAQRTIVKIGFFDEARVAARYSLADYCDAFDLVLPAR